MSVNTQRRPAVGGTAERQEQNTNCVHNTTNDANCQALLLDVLQIGAENAISGKQLSKLLGLRGRRDLQRLIADARAGGSLICATSKGYFLPQAGEAGRDEVAAFVAFVDSKAAATFRSANAARRFLSELVPGQTTITPGAEIGGGDNGEET